MIDAKNLSGAELAFLGDAYYSLLVREHLVRCGVAGSRELNRRILEYVTAPAQSAAYRLIEPILSEDEHALFRRGRNTSVSTVPRGAATSEYRDSTGIEALFGALYLEGGTSRAVTLFEIIVGGEESC